MSANPNIVWIDPDTCEKCMISGSVVVGDHCWIAPAAVTRDRITIGSHAFIGTGSVVTSALDDNARVMGNPAREIAEAKRLLEKLKQL